MQQQKNENKKRMKILVIFKYTIIRIQKGTKKMNRTIHISIYIYKIFYN